MKVRPSRSVVLLSRGRRAYVLGGAFALYSLGCLSCGGGDGAYTLLYAVGSWFSVVLHALFALDDRLLGGAVWAAYLNAGTDVQNLLFGTGVPVGFVACYAGTKWLVRRLSRRRPDALLLALHLIGSVSAAACGALCVQYNRAIGMVTHLVMGAVGVAAAGLFVRVDLLLQRLECEARRRSSDATQSRFCCSGCGYCLVGNASGRCPECGRLVDVPGPDLSKRGLP